jgi:hypothetical protein
VRKLTPEEWKAIDKHGHRLRLDDSSHSELEFIIDAYRSLLADDDKIVKRRREQARQIVK